MLFAYNLPRENDTTPDYKFSKSFGDKRPRWELKLEKIFDIDI